MTFLFAVPRNKLLIGSYMIRKAEGLHFSHSAIKVHGMVYESVWPKARVIKFEEWVKQYEIMEMYQGPELEHDDFEAFKEIHQEIQDDPYSLKQILTIWLSIVSECFGKYFSNREINGKRAWICTEHMALFQSVFFDYRFGKHLDAIRLFDVRRAAAQIAFERGWHVYKK